MLDGSKNQFTLVGTPVRQCSVALPCNVADTPQATVALMPPMLSCVRPAEIGPGAMLSAASISPNAKNPPTTATAAPSTASLRGRSSLVVHTRGTLGVASSEQVALVNSARPSTARKLRTRTRSEKTRSMASKRTFPAVLLGERGVITNCSSSVSKQQLSDVPPTTALLSAEVLPAQQLSDVPPTAPEVMSRAAARQTQARKSLGGSALPETWSLWCSSCSGAVQCWSDDPPCLETITRNISKFCCACAVAWS